MKTGKVLWDYACRTFGKSNPVGVLLIQSEFHESGLFDFAIEINRIHPSP